MLSVDDLISPTALRPVFQPIVDLRTSEIVGWEALARWPDHGLTVEAAFRLAAAAHRTQELDQCCAAAALRHALAAGVDRSHTIFVNIEPETLESLRRSPAWDVFRDAPKSTRVIYEVTERNILRSPGSMLRGLDSVRRTGAGIALDDCGPNPGSLALLPLVAPDVIKLDMAMLQSGSHAEPIPILAAALDHAERTGAVILAEGIESEAQRERAVAYGATLGQGFHLAQPGPLIGSPPASQPIQVLPSVALRRGTPADRIGGATQAVAPKSLLLAISRHLEDNASATGLPPVVLSTFQNRRHLTKRTRDRYAALARTAALVVVFAEGIDDLSIPGVRTVAIEPTDRLVAEWEVIVLDAHHAVALIARDLGDDGPDVTRRYAYTLTHRRSVVTEAARGLLGRMPGA